MLQGQIYDVTGRRLKRRVAELLERFDLTGAANRAARHYSGGMQRRLDIALGLLHEPEVLFLDEPTTGLDPEARAEMWKEIGRLTEQERLTILLTTHYLEEADELAAQLAIVDRGRVVAAGTPDELKSALEGDSLQVELAGAPPTARSRRAIERVARPERARRRRPAACARGHAKGATAMPSLHGRARRARARRAEALALASLARRRLSARRRPRLRRRRFRATRGDRRMRAVRHSWHITLRYLRAFIRQPAWVAITLVQPIIWLLLFGALFKRVDRDPRASTAAATSSTSRPA